MQGDDAAQQEEPQFDGWDVASVEQLRAELKAAHERPIVKDLLKYGDDHLEDSHYRWWWEFVRVGATDAALCTKLLADQDKAEKFRAVLSDFKSEDDDFSSWWKDQGRELFKETSLPYIDVIGTKIVNSDGVATPKVLLEVPLTMSRRLLRKQFEAIIDHFYPKEFMRHAASTARRKIEPAQKDRIIDYAYLLSIWTHRQSNPHLPLWEVHCLAMDDQDLRQRLGNDGNTSDERQELTKKAERAYKQSNELMENALIGAFPDDKLFQLAKRVGVAANGSANERNALRQRGADTP